MELDNIDFQILRLLSENSRIQWKDLGEQIQWKIFLPNDFNFCHS